MNLPVKRHCCVFIAQMGAQFHVIYSNQREWVIDSPVQGMTEARINADRCIEALRFSNNCKKQDASIHTLHIAENLNQSLLSGLHQNTGNWQQYFNHIAALLDRQQHILALTLSAEANNLDHPYLSLLMFDPALGEQKTINYRLEAEHSTQQFEATQQLQDGKAHLEIDNQSRHTHHGISYRRYFTLRAYG